jgi:hypothetical protein
LIVHLKADDGKLPVPRPGSSAGRVEDQGAQAVADTRQTPRAEAQAGAAKRAASRGRIGTPEVPQDRGAGGRDALARDPVIVYRKTFQQQGCRRRGRGHDPVRRPDRASAERQGRNAPASRRQRLYQNRRPRNVGNGVGRSDFVKRHRVGRHTMHPPLGFGHQGEDPDGVVALRAAQRGCVQAGADGAPRSVRVPVSVLMRVAGMMRCIFHEKAAARERVALMRHGATRHPCHGLHRLEHAFAMLRKRIQQTGDEHVSGGSAQRMKMDVPHVRFRSSASRR